MESKGVDEMETKYTAVMSTFEIHGLDNRVWIRPYAGNVEFNGETFDTLAEALAALPALARELGWTEYLTTIADFKVTK
jgi:hypothetical protein